MTLRAYSKTELAMAYAPYLTPGGAVNRLMSWIKHNAQLLAELIEQGYQRYQKIFTIKQVATIFKYLGEP